jgi:integrase/recombinase XerC
MPSETSFIVQFLVYLQNFRHYSEYTTRAYGKDLEQFVDFLFGDNVVADEDAATAKNSVLTLVTPEDINAYIEKLTTLDYKTVSMNRKLASLRSFYKWLHGSGRISQNPTACIRCPRTTRQPKRASVPVEQVMLLLAMPDKNNWLGARDLALLEIMITTGARPSELVCLTDNAVREVDGLTYLNISGTRNRTLTLAPSAAIALKGYLELRNKEYSEPLFLFINKHGESLSTRSIRRKLTAYLEVAGIDATINPYTLRHTYVQHLAAQGVSNEDVCKHLGLRAQTTLTEVYGLPVSTMSQNTSG